MGFGLVLLLLLLTHNGNNRLEGQIDFLQSQFALVGDKTTNEKSVLMMDGPADYLLYTSGRRNVQFGHWWFKVNCVEKKLSRRNAIN
jgi:hypothetical protein